MTIQEKFLLLLVGAVGCFSSGAAVAQDASKLGAPAGYPGAWFNDIDVPAEAVAWGNSGATKVELSVSETGEIIGCRVVESSGSSLLDEGTCATARQHGRFALQRDVSGKAVPFTYTLPRIRYVMSSTRSSWSADGGKRLVTNRTVRLTGSAAGKVETCRSLNTDATDDKACVDYPVGRLIPGYPAGVGARTVTLSQTVVMDAADGK